MNQAHQTTKSAKGAIKIGPGWLQVKVLHLGKRYAFAVGLT